MAAQPSVQIKVSAPYKGGTKVWSNRYHFTNGSPTTTAHWNTLSDNVVTQLKDRLPTTQTIVEAIYYDAGSDVPVGSKTYTTAGTHAFTGDELPPLEVCALLRWTTDIRTVKNHPVYLFSYIHGIWGESSSAAETVSSGVKSALDSYAADWVTGFSDGAVTHIRCGPNGAVAQSGACETYLTHRDFPR